MPSKLHEGIVRLFHDNPRLTLDLLRIVGVDAPVPDDANVRLTSETVRQLEPVELFADGVILLVSERPRLAPRVREVVEVHLGALRRKALDWPVYLTVVRRDHRCPVVLLVVTPSKAVARKASAPIVLGPGSVVRPIVIGPAQLPRIVDVERACEHLELAILSALAHGRHDVELEVLHPTFVAMHRAGLDDAQVRFYTDLILGRLGKAAAAAMEARMKSGRYEYTSDFAKRYVAEGEAKGRAEGRAEGEAKGRAEGEAKALLKVLETKGFTVPEHLASRVRDCHDLEQLDRWLERAVVAARLDEVFRDD